MMLANSTLGTPGTVQSELPVNAFPRIRVSAQEESYGKSVQGVPGVPTASEAISTLLDACNVADVRLRVQSGQLKYDAPSTGIPSPLREQLRQHKQAVIEFLAPTAPPRMPTLVVDEPTPVDWVGQSPALAVVSWPPRPVELSRWPIAWRERWGHRSNQLQDEGVPWPDHERQAFDEVQAEKAEAKGEPPRCAK
jgi:hypothetical protein